MNNLKPQRVKIIEIKVIFLLLAFNQIPLNAQQDKVDSLEILLRNCKSNDTSKINLLNKIASNFIMTNNFEEGFTYIQDALKIGNKLGYSHGLANSYYELGRYNEKRGAYYKAIYNYELSMKYRKGFDSLNYKAQSMNSIGNAFKDLGDYLRAFDYYQKSLEIRQELNDIKGIGLCLNNIGIIYMNMADNEKALGYSNKALKIGEQLNDKSAVSSTLNNIGLIYLNQDDYINALKYFNKALIIKKEINNQKEISNIFNNIGIIYSKQSDYSKGIEYFNKSLQIRKEIGYKKGICVSYLNLGEVYLNTKQYDLALEYTNKGLKIGEELNALKQLNLTHELLSEIYAAKKDYKRAYEHELIHKKLNDSIYNEKNIEKLTRLELKYIYEKEKQAIELEQQKKNTIAKKDLKYQKAIRNVFIIGLFISILIIFILIRLFRIKVKINHILRLKNKENYSQRLFISRQNKILHSQAKELYEHKEHLEEIVKQRTAELTIAKERAEESDKLKTAFLNNISHEFRTPMNAIICFSNLLANPDQPKDELEKYSEFVNEGCYQLLNIVNDTVELSKIHSKQAVIIKSRINILDFIAKIIADSHKSIVEKNIEIIVELNFGKDQTHFQIDANKFKLIFNHVLNNAIKFTHKGYIKISGLLLEDNQMQIQIEDTGIGIPNDLHEIIFEPYRQVEINTTKLFGGSGIGLSISKAYIELMGGKVWLESELGKGTTVFFTIPLEVKE
jgi:signal transduction histidine kinase